MDELVDFKNDDENNITLNSEISDIKRINVSKELLIPKDKSRNIYIYIYI